MKKHAISVLVAVLFVIMSAAIAVGQTTTVQTTTPTPTTTVVQNPDGTYTVIEYPKGKEVIVSLNPFSITGATGTATILRDDAGTRLKLNLTNLPANVTSLNLYAVDEKGMVTSLGPIAIANGVGTFTSTTPLSRFMLIASPETAVATYTPETKVFFRSVVPEGFTVIPHTMNPVGEQVSATAEPTVSPTPIVPTTVAAATITTYQVPMLNIPAYKKGDDTKMKIDFTGALTGSRANVFITPRKDGPTEIKMRFHELKDAPSGQVFVLWAVSADNKFVRLGQVVNTPGRNEAEIKSETSLPDFGLLVTMEDTAKMTETVVNPFGPKIGFVHIIQ
jgi:hypothetical protein